MALTRIDCDFFRGSGASAESSAYVALNPSRTPGSMVVGCSCATRTSLGSQVACKLALEHFVTGVLDFFDSGLPASPTNAADSEISLEVLEAAFKSANTSVYQFGHSLAAGGRMSASLLGVVIQDRTVAAARVGSGSAYLCRNGDLFPFFEPTAPDIQISPSQSEDSLVGAQSLVAVDLASVPIQAGDALLVFSERLDDRQERLLARQFSENKPGQVVAVSTCVNKLFPISAKVQFAMTALIGPDSIYLARPVVSDAQIASKEFLHSFTGVEKNGETI